MDIDAIRNNLRRPVLSARQRAMFATVVAASTRDGKTLSEFSAFVLEVPMIDDESEFLVVSARHCVTAALAAGAEIVLRVPIQSHEIDPANPPYVWETVAVPIGCWEHDDATDVSVAPLPLERLPPEHFLSSWIRGAVIGGSNQVFGDNVIIYGRGVLGDHGLVIRRRGALATHENPSVSLEIEPKTFRPVRVYVVEANVTPGMSGGLVLWTSGEGLAQNVALGLVHGYAYPNRLAGHAWGEEVEDAKAKDALARIQMEVEAARNELVYVIPGEDILSLIDRVATKAARANGSDDPKVHAKPW